jgi:hypothetical protein
MGLAATWSHQTIAWNQQYGTQYGFTKFASRMDLEMS